MMTEAGTLAGRRRASLALVLVLVPAEDAGELELTPMSIMYFLQSTCMSQDVRSCSQSLVDAHMAHMLAIASVVDDEIGDRASKLLHCSDHVL